MVKFNLTVVPGRQARVKVNDNVHCSLRSSRLAHTLKLSHLRARVKLLVGSFAIGVTRLVFALSSRGSVEEAIGGGIPFSLHCVRSVSL